MKKWVIEIIKSQLDNYKLTPEKREELLKKLKEYEDGK